MMYYPLGAGRAVCTVKDRAFLSLLRRLYAYLAAHPNTFSVPKEVVGREYSSSELRGYGRLLLSANGLSPNLSIRDILSLLDKTIQELASKEESGVQQERMAGGDKPAEQILVVSDQEIQRVLSRIDRILGHHEREARLEQPSPPKLKAMLIPHPAKAPSQTPRQPTRPLPLDHPPGFFFLATLPIRAFSPAQWLLSGQLIRGGVGLFLDAPWASRWRMHALGALLSYSLDPRHLDQLRLSHDRERLAAIQNALALYHNYLGHAASRTVRGKFFRWFWDPLIHDDHAAPIIDRRMLPQNIMHVLSKDATPRDVLLSLRSYVASQLGRTVQDGTWARFYEISAGTWRFSGMIAGTPRAIPEAAIHRILNAASLGIWSWVRDGYSSLLIWARIHGRAALLGGSAGGIVGSIAGISSGVGVGGAAGAILGAPGSLVGGFVGGVLGGLGGGFLGIPLGSTVGWSLYQVFSGFRLFGKPGFERAVGSAGAEALQTTISGAGGLGNLASGFGRSLLAGAGWRAATGFLAGLFGAAIPVGWIVLGVIGVVAGVTLYATIIQVPSGFIPVEIGGGDVRFAGAGVGNVGDAGNCTLSKEAITITIPDNAIETYIAKRGLDKEKASKIALLAKASGVNAAILYGIWKKESTFSKNQKMLQGADFGCGFPDSGKPSCKQPASFDESLQCVLNLSTGGVCNLANSLKTTGDFKAWMSAYTPPFYKPDGRAGYINFFGEYDLIISLVEDESLRQKLAKDCAGSTFIAAKYTGFPITPTAPNAITQCFLGGAAQCSHNPSSTGSSRQGWNGLDIYAPKGTPVYTLVSGEIKNAWYEKMRRNDGSEADDPDNLWVDFQGSDGTIFWYGHNVYILGTKNVAALTGRRLEAGQQIANVGRYQTDNNTHLHFEVSKSNRFINPCAILDCKQYRTSYGSCGKGCE